MKRPSVNVTEETLRVYVEAFHQTLDEVSAQFFTNDQAKQLLHKSLVPARIIGYISTQFGTALEYVKAPIASFETFRDSKRIEDLLFRAPAALRNLPPFIDINGKGSLIQRGSFSGRLPLRLGDSADATLVDVNLKAEAFQWQRHIEYAELTSDRTASRWSIESAQSRAKDEVLAALSVLRQSESRRVSLNEYVNSYQEKTVLVLGSYDTNGEMRLSAIKEELSKLGYEPILIKDLPDFEHADLRHKVTLIGTLCRFVFVDDTSPSGHILELQLCEANRWITVVLRGGQGSTFMTAGLSLTNSIIFECAFDPAQPSSAISEAIKWAEEKRTFLKVERNRIYPWRMS
jgi:hypothetical protein